MSPNLKGYVLFVYFLFFYFWGGHFSKDRDFFAEKNIDGIFVKRMLQCMIDR